MQIDGAWLKSRLTGTHGEKKVVADAIGLTGEQLSKVLAGTRRLSADEALAAMAYFKEPLPASPTISDSSIAGFADTAAVWGGAQAVGLTRDALLRAFAPHVRSAEIYQADSAVPALGILPGDLLVCDQKTPPTPGALVIAQVVDTDHGVGVTRIGRYLPPYVIETTLTGNLPMLLDGLGPVQIAIAATVSALVRDTRVTG